MAAWVSLNIENLERTTFQKGLTSGNLRTRWNRMRAEGGNHFRSLAVMGNHPVKLAVILPDVTHRGSAKPRRVGDESIENGLKIGRRGSDDSKHFTRRGLLLQGLSDIAVARLQLLE